MTVTQLDDEKRRQLLRKKEEEIKQKAEEAALRKRMNEKLAKKYRSIDRSIGRGGFFADKQTNIWLAIIAVLLIFSVFLQM